MKHDTYLANDLVVQSLVAQIAKLTARVEALELAARVKPRAARPRSAIPQAQAAVIAKIVDRCARMNGCTPPEICGAGGSKRANVARAESAFECFNAGIHPKLIGQALGGRTRIAVYDMIKGHKSRAGIE